MNCSENELSSHRGKDLTHQRWAHAYNSVFPDGRWESHRYPSTYWSLLPAVTIVINLHSNATHFLSLVGLLTGTHPQINPCSCSIHQNLTENSIFLFLSVLFLPTPPPPPCVSLSCFPLELLFDCSTLSHFLFCLPSSHVWLDYSLSSFFVFLFYNLRLSCPHLLFQMNTFSVTSVSRWSENRD